MQLSVGSAENLLHQGGPGGSGPPQASLQSMMADAHGTCKIDSPQEKTQVHK